MLELGTRLFHCILYERVGFLIKSDIRLTASSSYSMQATDRSSGCLVELPTQGTRAEV